MSNLKILTEEYGKLLKEYKTEVYKDDFDQAKCDRLHKVLEKKNAEIKLAERETEELGKRLGSHGPKFEIRDAKNGKEINQGSHEELQHYMRDLVKSAFGYNVQNRDLLGGSTSGAYIVPEHLRGPIISYVIEKSLLGRLGIPNVSVDTDVTKYAETTVLNVANTYAEGSEISEDDITLVPRTLQTFTYRSATVLSQELIDDAIEYPGVILEPLMQAIAENISNDLVLGAGTTEPMGVSNMTGMFTRYHMGVNGAVLTDFAPQEALWRKGRELNHNISHFLMSPRTLGQIRLLETGTEKVQLPNVFPEIGNVETNAVVNTETEGSGTTCSSIYGGNWKENCFAGWRYGSPESIKFIVDKFTLGEFLKVRIYAYTRVGIAYPRGYGVFGRIKGILGAAGAIT